MPGGAVRAGQRHLVLRPPLLPDTVCRSVRARIAHAFGRVTSRSPAREGAPTVAWQLTEGGTTSYRRTHLRCQWCAI